MPIVSATTRVLDYIISEMDAGNLEPGMRVVAAKVAAQLGLSITPVREALGQLAGRGVIELLPDRGAVVRRMTAEEAKKLWVVMAALAGAGIDLAAQAVSRGADTTVLNERYRRIAEEPISGPPITFYIKTNDYHVELHRLSGNEYIQDLVERAGRAFWARFLAKFIDMPSTLTSFRMNYRRMHDAVLAGDGPSAVAALNYHARWSVAMIKDEESDRPRRRRRRVPGESDAATVKSPRAEE